MGGQSTNTKSTTTRELKPTSQSNPFFNTTTDWFGNTRTSLVNGTAGKTSYDFVNKNIAGLLDQYLNPTLDSTTNKAKLNQFNKVQQQNLQNNIINPLARNNMIRSSQATNMYNNLSNQAADYANDLLANNQSDTWNMINNLMSLYSSIYNGATNEQSTGINASMGSGNTTTSSTGSTQ